MPILKWSYQFKYSNSAYDSEFFEDEDFQEATRLIELNLTVTRIGEQTISRTGASSALTSPVAPSSYSPAPSDLSGSDSTASQPAAIVSNASTSFMTVHLDERFPPIYFKGRSRGGNGNESKVRGRVYKTTDGCIRWCFVSVCLDPRISLISFLSTIYPSQKFVVTILRHFMFSLIVVYHRFITIYDLGNLMNPRARISIKLTISFFSRLLFTTDIRNGGRSSLNFHTDYYILTFL